MTDVNALESAIIERLHEVGLHPDRIGALGADLVFHVPGTGRPMVVSLQDPEPWSEDGPPASLMMIGRRHIDAKRARLYRDRGRPYVDSGGNMWLDLPGYHVHIEGRRPTVDEVTVDSSSRAFRPGGLRVVFLLLCWPERIGDPLRTLARLAGVSLGAAQGALADLESEGFLNTGTDSRRRLIEVGRLTRRWLELYPTRLRPKLETLALVGPGPSWWITGAGARSDDHVLLSGEAAMAELHSSIRPLTTTLWGRPPWGKARQHARLERGSEPNTFLYERFWDESLDRERQPTAPALLIYADALASGEPRQLEVAESFRRSDADLRRLFER